MKTISRNQKQCYENAFPRSPPNTTLTITFWTAPGPSPTRRSPRGLVPAPAPGKARTLRKAQTCTLACVMAPVSFLFLLGLWGWAQACPCVGENAVWKLKLKSELFGEPPSY